MFTELRLALPEPAQVQVVHAGHDHLQQPQLNLGLLEFAEHQDSSRYSLSTDALHGASMAKTSLILKNNIIINGPDS